MYLNNKGSKGRGRIKSPGYREWCKVGGLMLNTQQFRVLGNDGRLPIKHRVYLEIHLNSSRQGDWDNRIKPICDLLVDQGILAGDSKRYVKGGGCEWMDDMGEVECMVRITEADPYRG
jgi:hypothetical protein